MLFGMAVGRSGPERMGGGEGSLGRSSCAVPSEVIDMQRVVPSVAIDLKASGYRAALSVKRLERSSREVIRGRRGCFVQLRTGRTRARSTRLRGPDDGRLIRPGRFVRVCL